MRLEQADNATVQPLVSAFIEALVRSDPAPLSPVPAEGEAGQARAFLIAGLTFLHNGHDRGERPGIALEAAQQAALNLRLVPDLQACVLILALSCEMRRARLANARHLQSRLVALKPKITWSLLAHPFWSAVMALAPFDQDPLSSINACAMALAELPEAHPARFHYRWVDILARIKHIDLIEARIRLDRLEVDVAAGFGAQDVSNRASMDMVRDFWDLRCLSPDRLIATSDHEAHRHRAYMRFGALLLHGSWRRAEQLLAGLAPADLPERPRRFPDYPRALLDLHRERWDAVERRCALALEQPGNETLATEILLNAALQRRQMSAAGVLLEQLDPQHCYGEYLLHWLRWSTMVGDWSMAQDLFSRLRTRVPARVQERMLDRCRELRPSELVALTSRPQPNRAAAAEPATTRSSSDRWALIGSSPAMNTVRAQIASIAASELPVLILGETGTGKENAARLIHAESQRSALPFLAINAASLSDSLAEAELFGHAKGAFTGAVADRPGLIAEAGEGVLFIDEINSMPLRLQGLLLRLLELGEYRAVGGATVHRATCRFLFASNEDLATAVADRRFRADLRYRIERIAVHLPPLRDHPEDIPELCRHLLRGIPGGIETVMDQAVLDDLNQRPWPGNVRELRNALEHRIVFPGGNPSTRPVPPRRLRAAGASTNTAMPEPLVVPGPPEARERRSGILALFARIPEIYPADVARATGANAKTITRDLQALAQAGLIRRLLRSDHPRTNPYVLIRRDANA